MSRRESAAGPGRAARKERQRGTLCSAASALAIVAALGALAVTAPAARAQYQPYGNPLAGGPVPYSVLQGGGAQSQYYGQAYAAQPYAPQGYGYAQPYASGTGSIVYNPSVIGGGYQPPFYAGQAYQGGYQAHAAAPYGAPVMQGPPGIYGQAGGLYVPGPQPPVSQLYIQPGVPAPGQVQSQIGAATGMLPPAPPVAPPPVAPSSTPQVAAQTTPALPPAPPQVSPPPPSTAGTAESGGLRVPEIVEDDRIAEVPTPPPAPPAPPPQTPPPAVVDADEDIMPPPPPPSDEGSQVAAVEPPAPPAPIVTPPERVEATPPPPPPPPDDPEEDVVVATPVEPPAPPPDVVPAPPATADAPAGDLGGVALSISFAGGASELPAASEAELRSIAQRMLADESLRLTIRAYAEGTAEEPSPPRRLSLSRALAVRSFLIEQGIRGPRMDVRALGHRTEAPRDRVDLVLASQ